MLEVGKKTKIFNMIRTIIWYIVFWIYLVGTIFLYPLFLILQIFGNKNLTKSFLNSLTSNWGRFVVWLTGSTVTLKGIENIPENDNICFIANHQGGFDIPLLMGYMPRTVGFIAKKELKYIPIMGTWMKGIGCIFINRSNRRDAVKVIGDGVKQLKNGHPMVIFPEGTRSQSNVINKFKSGSLKLPIRAGAYIVPVTIDGSYKIKEMNGGIMKPAKIILTIHPIVDASKYRNEDTQMLATKLQETIKSVL